MVDIGHHVRAAVTRFFEDYKKNEHKEVKVDDIQGSKEAMKVIKDGLVSVFLAAPDSQPRVRELCGTWAGLPEYLAINSTMQQPHPLHMLFVIRQQQSNNLTCVLKL